MKVSEYIKELQALQDEYGDLEIWKFAVSGVREVSKEPKIEQLAELKPRERNERFLNSWDTDRKAKQTVIRI